MKTAFQLTSNNLLANLTSDGTISDLSWPIKGENNLLLRSHIWDEFWIDGTEIRKEFSNQAIFTEKGQLLGRYHLEKDGLGIEITAQALTDELTKSYIFTNRTEREIEISLFVIAQPDFGSNASRDTCAYLPKRKGMVHYEDDTYLLISSEKAPVAYACQSPTDFSGRGAKPDRNGDLTNNAVTIGRIETCLKYVIKIIPGQSEEMVVNYRFANKLDGLTNSANKEAINLEFPIPKLTKVNELVEELDLDDRVREKLELLAKVSKSIVYGSENTNGSTYAAVDSSYFQQGGVDDYSYFWPRDGALVNLAKLKYAESSRNEQQHMQQYFDFVSSCLHEKPYLMHRFRLGSGNLGSSWHNWVDDITTTEAPIQLDQTALTIYTYGQFVKKYGRVDSNFHKYIENIIEFLLEQVDPKSGLHKPCFDLWENHKGVFLSEQISIIAALRESLGLIDPANKTWRKKINDVIKSLKEQITSSFVNEDGLLIRSTTQGDNYLDSSFHWLWYLGVMDPNHPTIKATVKAAEERLSINGGFARYENDFYLKVDKNTPGNPWYISTIWFAIYYLLVGEKQKAKQAIHFITDHMDETGLLPEMSDPKSGMALSVKPLVWSHAEVLNLLDWKQFAPINVTAN